MQLKKYEKINTNHSNPNPNNNRSHNLLHYRQKMHRFKKTAWTAKIANLH